MIFKKPTPLKFPLFPQKDGNGSSLTTALIVALLGIHLTLITIGTFCASTATNPNPAHHDDHQASTSILCVWACQVGQIAASATPAENLTPLPFLILLGIILPLAIPTIFSPFFFASPRGPPLL